MKRDALYKEHVAKLEAKVRNASVIPHRRITSQVEVTFKPPNWFESYFIDNIEYLCLQSECGSRLDMKVLHRFQPQQKSSCQRKCSLIFVL